MEQDSYFIRGGKPLCGAVSVHGAKNAALPVLAAALLTREECVLENVPDISDIRLVLSLLRQLGVSARFEGGTVTLCAENLASSQLLHTDTAKLRASVLFLGPLLARCGQTALSLPGGCAIGTRPVDLHLMAVNALGAKTQLTDAAIVCRLETPLKGTCLHLPYPSVGATETLLLAAVTAQGQTVLTGAAQEPEIVDLALALISMGAKIHGAGTECILIEGVPLLHGMHHRLMPDRIEAGTYLTAAAMTGGEIFAENANASHLSAALQALEQTGCRLRLTPEGVGLCAPETLAPIPRLTTRPYPFFPTDMQPQLMALLTLAKGTSMMEETVFNARFHHARELCRMGAKIVTEGSFARIEGVSTLHGERLQAADLRGGAALALAALAAEGESRLFGVSFVERGYADFAENLRALGGDIVLCRSREGLHAGAGISGHETSA